MRSLIIACCVLGSASFAQQQQPTPKAKPQTVDFNPTTMTGERGLPIGELYAVPRKPVFGRLIQVRMNFNDKLAESVHER